MLEKAHELFARMDTRLNTRHVAHCGGILEHRHILYVRNVTFTTDITYAITRTRVANMKKRRALRNPASERFSMYCIRLCALLLKNQHVQNVQATSREKASPGAFVNAK